MAVNKLPVKITLAADSTIPALDVQLARVSGIDGKTQAQTTLYTVPTGKIAFVTHIMFRLTSASNVTGVASAAVGITPGWNTIRASTALTNLDTTGEYTVLQATQPAAQVAAAGVIKVDITAAATTTGGGDTYTLEVRIFGFLIDA